MSRVAETSALPRRFEAYEVEERLAINLEVGGSNPPALVSPNDQPRKPLRRRGRFSSDQREVQFLAQFLQRFAPWHGHRRVVAEPTVA